MSLSMLRYYIDWGAQKVVGGGEGQPEGGWEWEQDDVKSETRATAFVVIVVRQRLQKTIRAQACHADRAVVKSSILLTQAKPVPTQLLNWK